MEDALGRWVLSLPPLEKGLDSYILQNLVSLPAFLATFQAQVFVCFKLKEEEGVLGRTGTPVGQPSGVQVNGSGRLGLAEQLACIVRTFGQNPS